MWRSRLLEKGNSPFLFFFPFKSYIFMGGSNSHINQAFEPPSGGGPGLQLDFVDILLSTLFIAPATPSASVLLKKSGSWRMSHPSSDSSRQEPAALGCETFSGLEVGLVPLALIWSCFSMSVGSSPTLELEESVEDGIVLFLLNMTWTLYTLHRRRCLLNKFTNSILTYRGKQSF